MQQIEKELRLNQLRLIVIVATIIFAFMLVYTIYWLTDYKKEYGFFQKGEAVVVEHQEIDGKTYDLLSYEVNDNEFRITTEYESKNDIGDTVTIYYDEGYPLGVVYSLDSRRIVLPILSAVFGVVNVSLVAVYFLIRKSVLSKPAVKKGVENPKENDIVENVEQEKDDDVKTDANANTENKQTAPKKKQSVNATKQTTKVKSGRSVSGSKSSGSKKSK